MEYAKVNKVHSILQYSSWEGYQLGNLSEAGE